MLRANPVTDSVRNAMREVLVMYYEMEESRICKVLEERYRRIMLLFFISLLSLGLLHQILLLNSKMAIWEIVGNFSAFGLWQIGYVHFERSEGYDELMMVQCAKNAEMCFLDRGKECP